MKILDLFLHKIPVKIKVYKTVVRCQNCEAASKFKIGDKVYISFIDRPTTGTVISKGFMANNAFSSPNALILLRTSEGKEVSTLISNITKIET